MFAMEILAQEIAEGMAHQRVLPGSDPNQQKVSMVWTRKVLVLDSLAPILL
jgi:hypothetical protein